MVLASLSLMTLRPRLGSPSVREMPERSDPTSRTSATSPSNTGFGGSYASEIAGCVDGGLAPVHGDAADGGVHLGPAYGADHGVGGEAFLLELLGVEFDLDLFLRTPDEVHARHAVDILDGGNDVVF